MSIVDVISHALNEHSVRAQREGRALEANFVALIKEIVMTTVNELQGKINTLQDKMAQLEADTKDLVSKSGPTSAANAAVGSGIAITQDQVDSMGVVIDNVTAKVDALTLEVVHGPVPVAPVTPPPTPSTPSAGASTPATPSPSGPTPATPSATPSTPPVGSPSTTPPSTPAPGTPGTPAT